MVIDFFSISGDIPCENSLLRQVSSLLRRLPAIESEKFQDDFLMVSFIIIIIFFCICLSKWRTVNCSKKVELFSIYCCGDDLVFLANLSLSPSKVWQHFKMGNHPLGLLMPKYQFLWPPNSVCEELENQPTSWKFVGFWVILWYWDLLKLVIDDSLLERLWEDGCYLLIILMPQWKKKDIS